MSYKSYLLPFSRYLSPTFSAINIPIIFISPAGSSKYFPGKSCKDIKERTNSTISKEYWIKPNNDSAPFLVYCEMELNNGGWTLVYGYTFTNYADFYGTSNAVTPRPSWPAPHSNVSVSNDPPLNNKYGAIPFDLWQRIGEDIFIR